MSLLEQQKDQFAIETVADVKTALQKSHAFQPEVVIYFRETSRPEDETLLQELMNRHRARVIHCTLEADRLTIYDQTRINHATVDDLMAAVLK
jgi:chemotaxis response regulator CheB